MFPHAAGVLERSSASAYAGGDLQPPYDKLPSLLGRNRSVKAGRYIKQTRLTGLCLKAYPPKGGDAKYRD